MKRFRGLFALAFVLVMVALAYTTHRLASGRVASMLPTPEATVDAFTDACHAGDLSTARRLYPADELTRQTELRMQIHEETIRELCHKLSHTRPRGEPQIGHDGRETTVFYRYEQPPEGTWYPDAERPPIVLSWHLTRLGHGWAITLVTGA